MHLATKLQLYIQISRNFNPSESKMSAEVIIFCASNWKIVEQSIHCPNVFHNSREEACGIDTNCRVPKVDTASAESQLFAHFKSYFEPLLPSESLQNSDNRAESGQLHGFSFNSKAEAEAEASRIPQDIDSHGSDVVLIPKTFLQNLDR